MPEGEKPAEGQAAETSKNLSEAEQAARAALMRYDRNIKEIAFYDEIVDYGGNSTLVLAEVYWPIAGKPNGRDGPYEYQVVIRRGRAQVFDNFSQTFREGAEQGRLEMLTSNNFVTAVLTFVMVIAYIAIAGFTKVPTEFSQVLASSLTLVLGFWFGRQSKTG